MEFPPSICENRLTTIFVSLAFPPSTYDACRGLVFQECPATLFPNPLLAVTPLGLYFFFCPLLFSIFNRLRFFKLTRGRGVSYIIVNPIHLDSPRAM